MLLREGKCLDQCPTKHYMYQQLVLCVALLLVFPGCALRAILVIPNRATLYEHWEL